MVLLAKNLIENNQTLIVKRIQLKELSNNDVFNILKETRALENIKHSHIVNMINSFIYEDKLYIVMHYYAGGDLESYFSKVKKIHEKEAKLLFKQILEAIRFYSSKGIVHRNPSPNNILFTNENKDNIVV